MDITNNVLSSWLKRPFTAWASIKNLGILWKEYEDNGSTIEATKKLLLVAATLHKETHEKQCIQIKKELESKTLPDPGICWDWIRDHVKALALAGVLNNDRILTEKEEGVAHNIGVDLLQRTYTHYRAWYCGQQVFFIAAPLANKLLLTDIKNVTWNDLRLPFPAFVIQIPTNIATIIDHGKRPVEGIVVAESIEEKRRSINFSFSAQENPMQKDSVTLLSTLSCDEKYTDTPILDSDVVLSPDFSDNRTLSMVTGEQGAHAMGILERFACSIILYLSSHPEDRHKFINPEINKLHTKIKKAKGEKKKKRLKKQLSLLLNVSYPYMVGTQVTISPELQKVANAVGRGEKIPPEVASYVRGHHRMQAHGPKSSLRKMIWIEPFWRNLGAGPKTQKAYKVTL